MTHSARARRTAYPAELVAQAQNLRVGIGRVARRMRQTYAGHEARGPSFTEIAVLNRLDRDGACAPGQLAGQERVTSQAIAACVRSLEGRGLVSRQPDPEDRRRVVVAITTAGRRALHDREDAVMARLLDALSVGLAPTERDQLLAAAPLLHHIADCF